MKILDGAKGPLLQPKEIKFKDICQYIKEFPEDVDDKRTFIRMVQAIDREFVKHGLKSDSKRSS